MKLLGKVIFLLIFFNVFVVSKAFAADLSSASAILSTSRPSPSSPLSADASSSEGLLSIFNNGSRYLASDSGKIIRTGDSSLVASGIPIASQSSGLTSVYLSGTVGGNAGAGSDVLFVPITAMHAIRFTVSTTIPIGGEISIQYPGSGNNSASPSATTFAFNGLPSSTAAVKSLPETACNSVTVSAPTITCVTNAVIPAGTTVFVWVGCTSASNQCDTQSPYLINPSKGAASAGTADIWKIILRTTDGASTLDTSTISIGVIESVTIRANIDPSLTFTITGINNGVAVNTGNNAVGTCDQDELTNSGINSDATEVNLGTLTNTTTSTDTKIGNISAQLLTVSTNAGNGYVITATSSGKLRSPSTGFELTSTLIPQIFPAGGANFYGFHACGRDTINTDIGTTYWNTTASDTNCNSYISGSSGNICKYGWPTATSPITLASDTTGPIGNSLLAGNGLTSVSYAAGADAGVPPGSYSTVVTYVATPAF